MTAVLDLAALHVGNTVTKAAPVDFLVDFCATYIRTTSNHVYHRFLPAHQLTDDLIHEALFNERLDSLRDFHDSPFAHKVAPLLQGEDAMEKKMKNTDNDAR
jgi:hypothetical protein